MNNIEVYQARTVFVEANREEDITGQMFSEGYEIKEIADLKSRAISTINNQIASLFKKTGVRNGRQLATICANRVAELAKQTPKALCILAFTSSLSMSAAANDIRSSRRSTENEVEITISRRQNRRREKCISLSAETIEIQTTQK